MRSFWPRHSVATVVPPTLRGRCAAVTLVIIAPARSRQRLSEGRATGTFGPAPGLKQLAYRGANVAALAYGDWQLTLQKQSAKNAGRLPAAGQWLTFAAVRFRGG